MRDGDRDSAAERSVLPRLAAVIDSRREERPGDSYVVELLDGGPSAIGMKLVEEAYEVVQAAGEIRESGRGELIHEVADLLFHALVMLGWAEIPLSEVEAELERRFGIGGRTDKSSRAGDTG